MSDEVDLRQMTVLEFPMLHQIEMLLEAEDDPKQLRMGAPKINLEPPVPLPIAAIAAAIVPAARTLRQVIDDTDKYIAQKTMRQN